MTPTGLLRLLALASILVLSTLTPACIVPDDDIVDTTDDDDDALPTECTVEASGAVDGVTVYAEKADGSHVFAECTVEDGLCSLLAPAGLDLVIYAEGTNIVSCGVEVNLEPSATPHEIEIPMGYGGESHGYAYRSSEGDILGTLEVETTCQDGRVIVNTHGADAYEVVGNQLLNISETGVSGSVTIDLSLYELSNGARLERLP